MTRADESEYREFVRSPGASGRCAVGGSGDLRRRAEPPDPGHPDRHAPALPGERLLSNHAGTPTFEVYLDREPDVPLALPPNSYHATADVRGASGGTGNVMVLIGRAEPAVRMAYWCFTATEAWKVGPDYAPTDPDRRPPSPPACPGTPALVGAPLGQIRTCPPEWLAEHPDSCHEVTGPNGEHIVVLPDFVSSGRSKDDRPDDRHRHEPVPHVVPMIRAYGTMTP